MKVIKVKYYEDIDDDEEKIVPLDPQPVKKNGEWDYEKKGTDEKGDYIVIDYIIEDPVYINYDSEKPTDLKAKELDIITEEEWNETVTLDIESMDLTSHENVESVDANTSQEFTTTNSKTNRQTCSTGIGKSTSTIGRLFSSVCNAITSSFRR